MTAQGNAEIFDSYGHPPQYYHKAWLDWLKHYSNSLKYNRHAIQPIYSATCGLHCLFYLYHRKHGMTLEMIQEMYTTSKPLNDQLAEEDLESHTLKDITIDDSDFLINQLCTALYPTPLITCL